MQETIVWLLVSALLPGLPAEGPAAPAGGANHAPPSPQPACVDTTDVSRVVEAYFGILSGQDGDRDAPRRDWNRFRGLFLESARMDVIGVNAARENVFYPVSLDEYVEHVKEYTRSQGFIHRPEQLDRRCSGRIAGVFGRFESRNRADGPVIDTGSISFHLVHVGGAWKIAHVIWQSDPGDPGG